MKLNVCVTFVLLVCCLRRLDCSLPDFTPATAQLQADTRGCVCVAFTDQLEHSSTASNEFPVAASVNAESNVVSSVKALARLPGLCARLRRRRITIMCNLEKFCWRGRSHRVKSGQVCRCPRGLRCSHFFVHSL